MAPMCGRCPLACDLFGDGVPRFPVPCLQPQPNPLPFLLPKMEADLAQLEADIALLENHAVIYVDQQA